MKRKLSFLILLFLVLTTGIIMTGKILPYNEGSKQPSSTGTESSKDTESTVDSESESEMASELPEVPISLINASGMTLSERIRTPKGFSRTKENEESLGSFLRSYAMKEDGSPVLLYNGENKGNQNAHAAVFQLPIENYDLQQCADSVMRVYAEYYLSTGQADKISFKLSNGFDMNYSKWCQGYKIKVSGNEVSWVESSIGNTSHESFVEYLRMTFAYAGTASMASYESHAIDITELRIGDVFLKGGSPGHVVIVVDTCVDEMGRKAFLLAQGYMPAQEFHVLNNPLHEEDPWYYADEVSYPFRTPEYTFAEGSLRRLSY